MRRGFVLIYIDPMPLYSQSSPIVRGGTRAIDFAQDNEEFVDRIDAFREPAFSPASLDSCLLAFLCLYLCLSLLLFVSFFIIFFLSFLLSFFVSFRVRRCGFVLIYFDPMPLHSLHTYIHTYIHICACDYISLSFSFCLFVFSFFLSFFLSVCASLGSY